MQLLDGSDYVQANIIIGTPAQVAKRNYLRVIDEGWRVDGSRRSQAICVIRHGWDRRDAPSAC